MILRLSNPLFRFIIVILSIVGGYLLEDLFTIDVSKLENSKTYQYFTSSLLAIGLYVSTYFIDRVSFVKNYRFILGAGTFGVVLKIFIIGLLMFFLHDNLMIYFLIATIIGQIDPISVSASGGGHNSKDSSAIVRSWASFDDPITILVSFYVLTWLIPPVKPFDLSQEFVAELPLRIIFIASLGLGYFMLKRLDRRSANFFFIIFFPICFVFAIYMNWMLSIALMGLLLRPGENGIISKHSFEIGFQFLANSSLVLSMVLLGIVCSRGIDIAQGALLAGITFGSQIIVSYFLTLKPLQRLFKISLSKIDIWSIASAQQNGITSVILALLFDPYYGGIVEVVAPAIIFINIIYLIVRFLSGKIQAK